jgi:hypothetical protein
MAGGGARHLAMLLLGIATAALVIFNHVVVLWHLPEEEEVGLSKPRLSVGIVSSSLAGGGGGGGDVSLIRGSPPNPDNGARCPLEPECPAWPSPCAAGGGGSGGAKIFNVYPPRPNDVMGTSVNAGQGDDGHRRERGQEGEEGEMKNMILGMATQSLDLHRVLVFLESARQNIHSNTDIVILTDSMSVPGSARALVFESLGVREVVSVVDDNIKKLYHTNSHRWIKLRDFLFGEKRVYHAVLFTDVRDVVFQGDPFTTMRGSNSTALFVFREASPARRGEDGTIGTEQRNKGWVSKCFGSAGLEQVAGNVVSCAGVTLGGWDASKIYVSKMVEHIMSKSSCIDQGVHNYLVYSGILEKALAPHPMFAVRLDQGIVASMQSMPPDTVVRNRIGEIVNGRGGLPFLVVHQYDRSKHRFDPQVLGQHSLLEPGAKPTSIDLDHR